MKDVEAVLFDVDGVLALPPRMFSEIYSDKYGIDLDKLEPFYKSKDFQNAVLGKADLKELIVKHADKWHWEKDPELLLNMWFSGEHVLNKPLLGSIKKLRDIGIPVYLATQQEKYRAAYIQNTMFPGQFDGDFITCDIGYTKEEPQYWEYILAKLPGLKPEKIYFFDDTKACIEAAGQLGINAHLYISVDQVMSELGL